MGKSYYIDRSILLSYFAGELPTDRQKEVKEWIAIPEEDTKTARGIFQLYRAADTLNYMKHIDSVGAFHQVKDRIHEHQHRVSWMMWGQRITACLALSLLATTLYLILKNSPAEHVEIRTNPGVVAKASLPDGTEVRLNSGFSLKRPIRFTGDIRNVELDGEAYFEVHRDKSKRSIINTSFRIQAEVLSTEFNIEAYRTNSVVGTALVSGSAELSFLGEDNKQRTFVMRPNEEFIYNPKTRTVRTGKPYVKAYTAWKNGQVVLRDTPLSEALKILTRWFHMEFIVKDSTLYGDSFTEAFSERHLPLILEHFRLVPGIQYRFIKLEHNTQQTIQQKMKIELY